MKRSLYCAAAALSLMLGACSAHHETTTVETQTSTAPQSSDTPEAAATSSASPLATATATTATATSAPSVSYGDLRSTPGASQIEQLAALGVFGTPEPTFNPDAPIKRRLFAVWLFNANNALQNDDRKKIHPARSDDKSAFADLPQSDPDFAMIQGLQNSGLSVGFPDGRFHPEEIITREQAVALSAFLSCDYTGSFTGGNLMVGYSYLPDWKDKTSVSKTYVPVLAGCSREANDIASRAFGKIATFSPTRHVTRADAALMLWKINGRSAEDALKGSNS